MGGKGVHSCGILEVLQTRVHEREHEKHARSLQNTVSRRLLAVV